MAFPQIHPSQFQTKSTQIKIAIHKGNLMFKFSNAEVPFWIFN